MADLFDITLDSSAVISDCGLFRYRLDRTLPNSVGRLVIAYFGVNPSTADHRINDQTVKKWFGFTLRNGGASFIVGNPFAFRSIKVKGLALTADAIGPENDFHLAQIIAEADILVPCWGPQAKVPKALRYRYAQVESMLRASGKPIKIFGLTESGDPMHPLMLGYSTKLMDWVR